jgi:hypothetical protein
VKAKTKSGPRTALHNLPKQRVQAQLHRYKINNQSNNLLHLLQSKPGISQPFLAQSPPQSPPQPIRRPLDRSTSHRSRILDADAITSRLLQRHPPHGSSKGFLCRSDRNANRQPQPRSLATAKVQHSMEHQECPMTVFPASSPVAEARAVRRVKILMSHQSSLYFLAPTGASTHLNAQNQPAISHPRPK